MSVHYFVYLWASLLAFGVPAWAENEATVLRGSLQDHKLLEVNDIFENQNETGTVGGRGSASQSRQSRITISVAFGLTIILVLSVWAYQRVQGRRYRKITENLHRVSTADKVVNQLLHNFSMARLDEYRFRGIPPKEETIAISFQDLSATVTNVSKTVLAGVSGHFEAGHMAAIMGPSGAGKTTFLNVLCGKIGGAGTGWEVDGTVLVNGNEMAISDLKKKTGFVPQDDVVHEHLTVRENILFSALLRNSTTFSAGRNSRVADDVLQVLQLEPQQNILVGSRIRGHGLSGGQRKRVNVGIELAACPTVLFLDEPTSGLDATSSLMLVKQLKRMTGMGVTVIMVIHQPRYGLFTLIDDVLLLGKGGQTVYIGPTCAAKPYFEKLGFQMPVNENPSDWMMDVLSGQVDIPNPRIRTEELPDKLFELWEQSPRVPAVTNVSGTSLGRSTNDADDVEIMKRHLKDEWNKICPDGCALDSESFKKVLSGCTGMEPEQEVVELLMRRIVAGGGVTQTSGLGSGIAKPKAPFGFIRTDTKISDYIEEGAEDEVYVTLTQFQRYLLEERRSRAENVRSQSHSYEESQEETSDNSSSEEDSGSQVPISMCESADSVRRARSNGLMSLTQPGFLRQTRIILHQRLLVWWRMAEEKLFFLMVIVFAAAFLGIFDRFIFDQPTWMPSTMMNAQISIGLLTSVYCLQTFSLDQPVYWREASHGLNRLSFLVARTTIDAIDWILMCFVFVAIYYIIVSPQLGFLFFFWPFLLVAYVASGWGYVISAFLPPALCPFVAAISSFVLGGILGLPQYMSKFLKGGVLELSVSTLSYTRWGVQMDFYAFITMYDVVFANSAEEFQFKDYKAAIEEQSYRLTCYNWQWWTGVMALLIMGSVLRVFAYIGLHVMNRSKQV